MLLVNDPDDSVLPDLNLSILKASTNLNGNEENSFLATKGSCLEKLSRKVFRVGKTSIFVKIVSPTKIQVLKNLILADKNFEGSTT